MTRWIASTVAGPDRAPASRCSSHSEERASPPCRSSSRGTAWERPRLGRRRRAAQGDATTPSTPRRSLNRSLLAVDFQAGQLPAGPAGAAGPAGPAGPAGTGATLAFGSATGANATATSSTTFVELPGASASVTVPTGATATLFVSFSAESLCTGPSGFCPVRVLVDGNEAAPVVGTDFAFDSTDGGPRRSRLGSRTRSSES